MNGCSSSLYTPSPLINVMLSSRDQALNQAAEKTEHSHGPHSVSFLVLVPLRRNDYSDYFVPLNLEVGRSPFEMLGLKTPL